ncbi:hypothetical protein E4T56_gene11077 [Termitomyces sp. T112]|nr:hypothetical protein E4T56_gene11077 [Termitomyces sp. T112]
MHFAPANSSLEFLLEDLMAGMTQGEGTGGSKEREQEAEDVEMRETTPLATVMEVKPAASRGEVGGKEEGEAEAIEVNENAVKDEEKV